MRGRRGKGRSGRKSGRERMGGGKRRGRGEDEEEEGKWEEKDLKQKLEHISNSPDSIVETILGGKALDPLIHAPTAPV